MWGCLEDFFVINDVSESETLLLSLTCIMIIYPRVYCCGLFVEPLQGVSFNEHLSLKRSECDSEEVNISFIPLNMVFFWFTLLPFGYFFFAIMAVNKLISLAKKKYPFIAKKTTNVYEINKYTF